MTQQHSLTWGALDFVDPNPTDAGYLLEACADGSNFGNPKALIQTVRSLLTDGSLAVIENWDNREIPIRIRISAPDAIAGPALAAGEAALMAELRAESKAPLVFTPPATDAPASYYDVVVAELERDYGGDWDAEESLREERYYLLTLTCLPFARPEATTVVAALGSPVPPGSATVTNIDDGTSTTNWAYTGTRFNMATLPPALVSSGGAVVGSGTVHYGTPTIAPFYEVARTGTISFATEPYLRVSASVSGDGGATFSVSGVGTLIASNPSAIAGATDYYYDPPGSSISSLNCRVTGTVGAPEGAAMGISIHHVATTNTIGDATTSTTRQQARVASVSGSAPTQAAIRLYDATPAALGTEILVHTSRNSSWQPPLRRWRTSGSAVTADAAMISGGRHTLATASVFRIPANLLTEGTYSLMARLNVTTLGTVGWSAKMVSSAGATTVGSSVVTSGSVTVGVTSGYQVINLAALPLPVVKAEADQMVELTLTGTSNMTVDEVWLFGLHDGVLTWLRDADSLTWIEIRSPELGAARPSIYGGTGAKGANSIDVSWKAAGATYGSFGAHRFDPGLMQIFTVTSTSLVSQSEIEFYPRYHSHVEAA